MRLATPQSANRGPDHPPIGDAAPATGSRGSTIPAPASSFVGRTRELSDVLRLIGEVRLVTLSGIGGCGKTRLAIEVAVELEERFSGGVAWVELGSLWEPAHAASAVAIELGVHEPPGRRLEDTMIQVIRASPRLLVLDNCEHLIDACAPLADRLLRACPELRILTTSREALGIPGETVYPLPPLASRVTDGASAANGSTAAGPADAVRLFAERARAADPTFTLTDENEPAVAALCSRLDGIPLAIELVAARVRSLGIEGIARRLDDAGAVLDLGVRAATERQRTLRATLEWSEALLSDPERILWHRLAVFACGFHVGTAEAVCGGDGVRGAEVGELIGRLVDRSLVVAEGEGPHGPRYRLLEVVREFGRERLAADPSTRAALRRRHAEVFLAIAESMAPRLCGAERTRAIGRLASDHDNLRSALAWTLETPAPDAVGGVADGAVGRAVIGLRMAAALWWFWLFRGMYTEGCGWLGRVLAYATDAGGTAPRPLTESQAHARALATALTGAGEIAWARGDIEGALVHLERCVALERFLPDDPLAIASARSFLSQPLLAQGEVDAASREAEAALAVFRASDDEWGLASALMSLGVVRRSQQRDPEALALFAEAAERFRRLDDPWAVAIAELKLGTIERRRGELEAAEEHYRTCIRFGGDSGEGWLVVRGIEEVAQVALRRGEPRRAAWLLGVADVQREHAGAAIHPLYQAEYDTTVSTLREALGEAELDAVWSAGAALPLAEGMRVVLEGAPELDGLREAGPGTAAHPQAVRIVSFGGARLERNGRAVHAAQGFYGKPRELLFYLLCHPGSTREQVGLALWPEASAAQLRRAFHDALHDLRRALGGREWIVHDHGRYALSREMPYTWDVDEIDRLRAEARELRHQDPAGTIARLERAVTLLDGGFLAGDRFGDWHTEQHDRLARVRQEGLLELGRLYALQQRHAEAADVLRRAVAADPFHEAAHRELMRNLTSAGEPAQALRHYRQLRGLLRRELGARPAAETQSLAREIRRASLS